MKVQPKKSNNKLNKLFIFLTDIRLTLHCFPQTLLAIARVGRGGRQRRKRAGANTASGPEHSPLDLSAASESACKRARLSASPSTRSESDERDRTSGDGEKLRLIFIKSKENH